MSRSFKTTLVLESFLRKQEPTREIRPLSGTGCALLHFLIARNISVLNVCVQGVDSIGGRFFPFKDVDGILYCEYPDACAWYHNCVAPWPCVYQDRLLAHAQGIYGTVTTHSTLTMGVCLDMLLATKAQIRGAFPEGDTR
jgi:hypothetical protein